MPWPWVIFSFCNVTRVINLRNALFWVFLFNKWTVSFLRTVMT
ncbi:hypothetical protein C2W58_00527 [Bacillus pumilus]|uniref:Uncharacterized protein n=1 Tax=Bacillus pumilus TaxID=1408 RepID=A0AB34QS62_BACPU|nr:hypothetical protein B4127_1959 [Bacillus pumilus]RAP17172.1 hypothetical protein C2W58_00527 [Bacillus pumilus]